MPDQILVLREVLRLSQLELEKFKQGRLSLENALGHVETLLSASVVRAALRNLQKTLPEAER